MVWKGSNCLAFICYNSSVIYHNYYRQWANFAQVSGCRGKNHCKNEMHTIEKLFCLIVNQSIVNKIILIHVDAKIIQVTKDGRKGPMTYFRKSTLSVKRNITSSERHTLKSKAWKWLIIGHRLAIILLTKHIIKKLCLLESNKNNIRWNRKRSFFQKSQKLLASRARSSVRTIASTTVT